MVGMSETRAYTFSHNAMATTFRVTLYAEEREYAWQAARALFAEADRLEKELSRFYPVSDISRINSLYAGESTQISADTMEVLKLAYVLWSDTDGVFDVTVGSKTGTEDFSDLRGFNGCHIDPDAFSVTILHEGLQFDLGGIGKGYALDRMADMLDDWDITTALLHSGESSVLPVGTPVAGNAWSIALRHPKNETVITTIEIRDTTISGSGVVIHGNHIIDPRTGKPATIRAATWATAPSAAISDALSTAFMIMTEAEIEAYINVHPEVNAYLYTGGEAVSKLPENVAAGDFGVAGRAGGLC